MRWVVDPIDGTVNFLYGLPQYAVSIAAERDGEVVAGVVLNVADRAEYVGAPPTTRCRRVPATASRSRSATPRRWPQRLLGTGFNYVPRSGRCRPHAWPRLLPQVRDIRRLGSCALDLCHVAEGALDGYVEEGLNPWDHAAGGLIAGSPGPGSSVPGRRWDRIAGRAAPEPRVRRTFLEAGRERPGSAPESGE